VGSTELPAVKPKAPAKRAASRPLTSRELTNRLLRLASQRHQPRSAVKVHLGPRGQVMVDVLVQAGDTAEQVKAASALAQAEFDALRRKYVDGELPPLEVVGRGSAAGEGDE
jgi:hypothetical protein